MKPQMLTRYSNSIGADLTFSLLHGRMGLVGMKDVRRYLRGDLSFVRFRADFTVYLPSSGNRFIFDFENDIFIFE